MPTVALVLLGIAGFAISARVVIGPSVADRVVALDSLLIVVIGILITDAARTDSTAFLNVAVVMGLLGFISTGVAARFIERRGA